MMSPDSTSTNTLRTLERGGAYIQRENGVGEIQTKKEEKVSTPERA